MKMEVGMTAGGMTAEGMMAEGMTVVKRVKFQMMYRHRRMEILQRGHLPRHLLEP